MYVIYVCMPECCRRVCACVCMRAPDRTRVRQQKSEIAEVNIRCNQQMTTQKMEGAEMEGLSQCRGGGKRQGVLT